MSKYKYYSWLHPVQLITIFTIIVMGLQHHKANNYNNHQHVLIYKRFKVIKVLSDYNFILELIYIISLSW